MCKQVLADGVPEVVATTVLGGGQYARGHYRGDHAGSVHVLQRNPAAVSERERARGMHETWLGVKLVCPWWLCCVVVMLTPTLSMLAKNVIRQVATTVANSLALLKRGHDAQARHGKPSAMP